ncbi:MAG: ECF transporter S component [Spirochaetales bacterium]|nr:ECF transporter S component [Spirochaetales bacterium]
MSNFVYHINTIVHRNRWKSLLILIPLFAALNLGFSWFNNYILRAPLFFDSIFTAAGAVCFGPLAGTLIAALTNLGMELMYGMAGFHWPFMICSISTALILGFMAKGGYFSKQIHLTLAILAVTVSNALTGSILAYLLFSGNSGVGIDVIVSAFTETGMSVLASAFVARLPANLIDKMIAVYAAFGLKVLFERVRGEKVFPDA